MEGGTDNQAPPPVAAADLPVPPCRRCTGEDLSDQLGFCFCKCHEEADYLLSLDPPLESIAGTRTSSEFAAAAAAAARCNAAVAQAAVCHLTGETSSIRPPGDLDARRVMPKSKVKFPDDRSSLQNIPNCVPYVVSAAVVYAVFFLGCCFFPAVMLLHSFLTRPPDAGNVVGKTVSFPSGDVVAFELLGDQGCSADRVSSVSLFARVLGPNYRYWITLMLYVCIHLFFFRHHLLHLAKRRWFPYDVEGEFTLDHAIGADADQWFSALKPQSPLCGRYGFVSLKGRVHHILALINPTSGGKLAMVYYQQLILPELRLLFGPKTKVLPIVLDEKNGEFICSFLHQWSHVFDLCLILGGDGSYHSIVNLLVRGSLERQIDELGAKSSGADGDENTRTGSRPATSRHHLGSHKCDTCKRKKCVFPIGLPITPVPLGTSNTWCSEFVFSHAGPIAAKRYAADARQAAAAAMEQVARERGRGSAPQLHQPRHPSRRSCQDDTVYQTGTAGQPSTSDVSVGEAFSLLRGATGTTESSEADSRRSRLTDPGDSRDFVDPAPATGPISIYQVLPGICDSSKFPTLAAQAAAQAARDDAALARGEACTAARALERQPRVGDTKEVAEEVAETQEAAAAAEAACNVAGQAAQVARGQPDPMPPAGKEDSEQDKSDTKEQGCADDTPAAKIVADMAAQTGHGTADLAECSRLLAPAADAQLKGVRLAKHYLRVAKMMDELAEKMGPGKDSNMTSMGRERLLHFWMRRIRESRTTRINALLVEAGGERHLCCNSLEFGFIGTAQVHSEDVRKAGHARYTAAFLYQLLMRRTFAAHITATLPSGEVVSRIGDYMVVALDVIQHWTDDRPVARQAQMDGPCAWLLLLDAKISRARLWAYMRDLRRLSMAEEKGLEMLPVKRVHIKLNEPGIYGLDGEVYRHKGELTFTLLPGPFRVFVSEFDQLIAHPAIGHRWMKHLRKTA
ncbi:transmembrane protein [Cystoisospora suis]|uniref:Transmembrane protein n=1 Tax=Cystoisospora suis TaxID=483139 RepID=A0A2C6K9G1_9APIC|nr:transmembrane protein [Cystoisospora suis]